MASDDVGRVQLEQNRSHCGGGTGADGWSVSPVSGADGSGREKTRHMRQQFEIIFIKNVNIL